WRGGVLLEEDAVDQILQVREGLSLAANETTRIVRLNVEQQAVIEQMFFHGGFEAEQAKHFFQGGIGAYRHNDQLRFFGGGPAGALAAAAPGSSLVLVSFICAIVSKFCTVQ